MDLQGPNRPAVITWLHTCLFASGLNLVQNLDEGLEVLGLGLKG